MKTSSIHYYFPGKDDLLYEAVEAYSARALAAARHRPVPARAQLEAYLSLMESRACDSGELCLGGMLAAEVMTLPDRVRARCKDFSARTKPGWRACWPARRRAP